MSLLICFMLQGILFLSLLLLVSGDTTPGPLASITQRIARWFWPNKDNTQQQGLIRSGQFYTQEKAKTGECSPCNAIPWIPIARAVQSVPATYNDNGQQYSFHVPTISLAALPLVSNQYGPPRPEYGPPKPEYGPPKPEYGPPKPEYGPPKPEYGPPKPEYGPPKSEYGPPKPEYGPPKPEYESPKPDYGSPKPVHELPKTEYGPPKPEYESPKPDYGSPKPEHELPKTEYGPPKFEYGQPKPQYGQPKPQNGPPKTDHHLLAENKPYNSGNEPEYSLVEFRPPPNPEYGPPKHENPDSGFPLSDYGPNNQEYVPLKPNFRNPKPDYRPGYGPPQMSFHPLKPDFGYPKPEYGPPKQEYGPPVLGHDPSSHENGPPAGGQKSGPQYLPPPIKSHGSPRPVNGPNSIYGPPKNHYGPPRFNNPSKSYGTPPNSYGPPKGPEVAQSKPKPNYVSPSQLRIPGPTPHSLKQNTATDSISYQQFLSPPPLKGAHYSSLILQPIKYSHLSSNPLSTLHETQNFGTPNSQHPKVHSNVVLTIQESDNACRRCPPSGPELSHDDTGLEPVKHGIADFGQLPLSDSAHEASSVTVSHLTSSTEHPQQTNEATQVFVTKSIPVSEYLSSIEYPMQIIQAPILDVPTLPKYVDLGYHTFNQHLYNHYHDNDKSSSLVKSLTTNLNSIPRGPKENKLNDNQGDATFILSDSKLRDHLVDTKKNSTVYEAEIGQVPTWHTTQSQSSPQPFILQSSSTPKPRQMHQIIIPYVRDPPQARKVPPLTQDPHLSAVYVNGAVTAPDNAQTTNINYPLTATGSENLESLHIPQVLKSLPPDVMNKLLELGFSAEEPGRSNLQHVVADNIRALLQGEEDSVDLAKLQKNIDTWTVEGYGKRETIPQQNSKIIPEEYLTTPATEEETKTSPPENETDHEMSASQHYPITFKVQEGKNREDEGVLIHEMNGWSLAETKLKTTTEQTLTTKSWEESAVSISPLTKEKVYVVTPLTTFPLSLDNSTRRTPVDRITTATAKKEEVIAQARVTTERLNANSETPKRNDIEEEIAATVKYLGSAANLSRPSPS